MANDPLHDDLDEELQKSAEAIREMEAGDRGVPFDEFVAAFREKYNLPPRVNDRIPKG